MKRLIFSFLTTLFCLTLNSQRAWEASLSMGYLTNGSIQFVEGLLDIKNAPTYQFNIGTSGMAYRDLELEYKITPNQTLDFTPSTYSNGSVEAFSTRVTTHTIGLNGVNYFNIGSPTRLYGVFGIYLAIFDFEAPHVENRHSTAFRLGLGVKRYFWDHLGIKAQISYNAPVQFSGTGIYAGVGSGGGHAGLTLNSSVLYSQGDFLLGVVYKF